jgi:hypothetical protein
VPHALAMTLPSLRFAASASRINCVSLSFMGLTSSLCAWTPRRLSGTGGKVLSETGGTR